MLVTGCEDKRRHKASEQVAFPTVDPSVSKDATPDEAAFAFLDAMRTLQSIRAVGFGVAGNKEKYDEAMGRIAALIAKDAVHNAVIAEKPAGIPRNIERDAAVRLVVESWVSTLAHYLDGVDRASVNVTTLPAKAALATDAAQNTEEATVRITAENPREREWLNRIEALPEIAQARTTEGDPLPKDGEAYAALVRAKAIAHDPSFNFPIGARIAISLIRRPEGWRVTRMTIEGAAWPTRSTQPR